MARKIEKPSVIEAAGNKPKIIQEVFGNVNSGTDEVSIAHMKSPGGWVEPAQIPEFNEYTYVLSGELKVETKSETFFVKQGEAILAEKGEWVRYSTPGEQGAEYVAVCTPAFSPDRVHREDE